MKRLKKEDRLRIQYAIRKPRPSASHSSLNLFKGAHLGPGFEAYIYLNPELQSIFNRQRMSS